jgi:hypothetical protein
MQLSVRQSLTETWQPATTHSSGSQQTDLSGAGRTPTAPTACSFQVMPRCIWRPAATPPAKCHHSLPFPVAASPAAAVQHTEAAAAPVLPTGQAPAAALV